MSKVKTKSFFKREALAIYCARLRGQRMACSLDAEWDQKISNAYRTEVHQREQLFLGGADEADAQYGFSLTKLATMLGKIRIASSEGEEAQ